MMRRPIPTFLLTALAAVGLCLSAVTGEAAASLDPRAQGLTAAERLEVLVDRVKQEQEKVMTLTAEFTQRQESAFLLEPEVARGTFSYAAPDQVRWEYKSPKPITMVIDGKTMTTWYRDLAKVEEVKVGRYSDRVLRYLGAGGSMGTLLEYFEVAAAFPADESQPYRLELTPRYDRVAKRLKSLTIWIDPVRFVPSRVRYVGGDGAVTEYRFEELEINAALPSDNFHLSYPEGVEVRVVDLDRAP